MRLLEISRGAAGARRRALRSARDGEAARQQRYRTARRYTLALLLWLVGVGSIGQADERRMMRGSVSPRATAANLQGRASAHEFVPLSITLELQRRDELQALLVAQQDPTDPEFHHWLTPEEFTARFAPPSDTYASVVHWLESQGFPVRTWPNRLRVDFSGQVADIETAFGVRMNHYRHRGRRPIANEDAPSLPASFAASVSFVRLDTFALAEPLVRVVSSNGSTNAMGPSDLRLVYGVQPLLDRGIDGTGQMIAVVARSDFKLSDVTGFQDMFAVGTRVPVKVFPATNPGIGAAAGMCEGIENQRQQQGCMNVELGEVLLDTEWAGALAPGATVMVDIGDPDIDVSLLDIVTQHPEAKTITMSFGTCERFNTHAVEIFGPIYAQAAAQGQTVLVATGDGGADECRTGEDRGVNALASDANVTAVGGTSLNPGFDANGAASGYVSEVVWDDPFGASGGGVSSLVPKPAYQSAPGVPADDFRDQPDVSLLASPQSPGYVTVFRGAVQVIGGTSAATPNWAAIVALLNHSAGVNGLGALNPMLYRLGRQQYAGTGPAVFHDVTTGNNSFNGVAGWSATPGFDLATGLGTPDVSALARTFNPCTGDCNGDGVITVDELVSGANIALGVAPLSQCVAFDSDANGTVTVDELLAATSRALNGC